MFEYVSKKMLYILTIYHADRKYSPTATTPAQILTESFLVKQISPVYNILLKNLD